MPGAVEGLVFAALASNAVTFPLAGSAFAISAISTAVTSGLFLGAQLALTRRSGDQSRPDRAKDTIKIADAPLLVCMGRFRIGGNELYQNSAGAYLYRHTALCHGPIDGFENYYLNNRIVVVGAGGRVVSPPYVRFFSGSPAYYAQLHEKVGTDPETAYSQLTSAFSDLIDSSHRGDALAQLLAIFQATDAENFLKVYPNGKPSASSDVRGEKFYDPRTETTVWSDNGPLGVLHFLISPEYMGWGLPTSMFDMDDIADTADAADELIALKEGGTEKRSRIGGVYSCDRSRGEILADLLLSTATRIVRLQNGKFSIRLEDDNPTAELTIDRDNIEEFDWSSGPESFEKPNRMAVKYFPEEQDYSITELVTEGLRWGTDETEISRVGERKAELTLNFCPSHGQASRIARRVWYARRTSRGQVRTNLAGMGALGRTFASLPHIGTTRTLKVTMQQPELESDRLHVTIPFVESPAIPTYDPDQDQADAPDELPSSAYSGNVAKPSAPSEAVQVQYPGGSYEIRARLPAAGVGLSLFAAYTQYVSSVPQPLAEMTVTGTLAYVADNETGNRVDFQVAQYDESGEMSEFSDELTVNPLAIDNTATGAPSVTPEEAGSTGHRLTFSVPDLRAVKVVVTWTGPGSSGSSTLNEIRPDASRTVEIGPFVNEEVFDQNATWSVTSYTSNDTAGTAATGAFVIPGNPP